MNPRNVDAPANESFAAPPRKRVRRWHHRVFTGCSICRYRRVRCDETMPICKNCTRRGLKCDATQDRTIFSIYDLPQTKGSHKWPRKRDKNIISPSSGKSHSEMIVIDKAERDDALLAMVSPSRIASPPPPPPPPQEQICFSSQQSSCPSKVIIPIMHCTDEQYITYFIDEVSTLLLRNKDSRIANPYRIYFPDLAISSPLVAGAMNALGALHLANTAAVMQQNHHFQRALSKYSEVVRMLRAHFSSPMVHLGINEFATCLLLCLFEMMDSQHQNWALHLNGAREIYNLLFSPHTGTFEREAQRATELKHPLRPFLVSLFSYLDVAGARTRPGGTVVNGTYWKALKCGWEYNLGTPSLVGIRDDPALRELRAAWSNMMEVQVSISRFADDKRWMSSDEQDMIYRRILNRLIIWRASAPLIMQILGDMKPDDEHLLQFPFSGMLEYAGRLEAYEKATIVHLPQVNRAGRVNFGFGRTCLDKTITRILSLIRCLSKDTGQLDVLWPLFIAGQETRKEDEQKYVRETMEHLKRFGFRNVDKSLELLESLWLKRRMYPERWTETVDELYSNILLP